MRAESLRILRFRVSVDTAGAATATQRMGARGAGRHPEAASERLTGTRDENDISSDVSERLDVPTNERSLFLLRVQNFGVRRANQWFVFMVFSSPDLAWRAPPEAAHYKAQRVSRLTGAL